MRLTVNLPIPKPTANCSVVEIFLMFVLLAVSVVLAAYVISAYRRYIDLHALASTMLPTYVAVLTLTTAVLAVVSVAVGLPQHYIEDYSLFILAVLALSLGLLAVLTKFIRRQ